MRLGLTDMVGLAASLIFALPLGLFAVNRLFAGEIALGVGLLVVAAAMVVLPQYFLDPARILRGLVVGLLPRQIRGLIALDPAEAGSSDSDPSAEPSIDEEEQTDAPSEDATPVEK
ncbi:DUF7533 family protein [Halorubrum amylolyticum]|uniref:DUF7533 family protein n=1 Tax=Halorubrum amylolyticum TaxID=2508724 RepID=UPI001008CDE7|nr:hypothetical protein [Halorubrum amylolyticum]